jgi:hypothetical protein
MVAVAAERAPVTPSISGSITSRWRPEEGPASGSRALANSASAAASTASSNGSGAAAGAAVAVESLAANGTRNRGSLP